LDSEGSAGSNVTTNTTDKGTNVADQEQTQVSFDKTFIRAEGGSQKIAAMLGDLYSPRQSWQFIFGSIQHSAKNNFCSAKNDVFGKKWFLRKNDFFGQKLVFQSRKSVEKSFDRKLTRYYCTNKWIAILNLTFRFFKIRYSEIFRFLIKFRFLPTILFFFWSLKTWFWKLHFTKTYCIFNSAPSFKSTLKLWLESIPDYPKPFDWSFVPLTEVLSRFTTTFLDEECVSQCEGQSIVFTDDKD